MCVFAQRVTRTRATANPVASASEWRVRCGQFRRRRLTPHSISTSVEVSWVEMGFMSSSDSFASFSELSESEAVESLSELSDLGFGVSQPCG